MDEHGYKIKRQFGVHLSRYALFRSRREYSDWPVNKENGKNISFYENNNFGGYKSYHVFGKYTDFFGAYWHDDDFGMGRYSTHDDKAGKRFGSGVCHNRG